MSMKLLQNVNPDLYQTYLSKKQLIRNRFSWLDLMFSKSICVVMSGVRSLILVIRATRQPSSQLTTWARYIRPPNKLHKYSSIYRENSTAQEINQFLSQWYALVLRVTSDCHRLAASFDYFWLAYHLDLLRNK